MTNPPSGEGSKSVWKGRLFENREAVVGFALFVATVVYWRFVDDCRFAANDCHRLYYPLISSFVSGQAFAEWNDPVALPLLTLLQGGVMSWFGIADFELAALVMHALLLIPCVSMTYLLAKEIGKSHVSGSFAVLLLLTNPIVVWRTLTTGNELLYGALLITFCYSLTVFLNRRSVMGLISSALCCALLSLTRAEGFAWTLLFLGALLLHGIMKKQWKFLSIAVGLLVVFYVILVGPRLSYMKQVTDFYILDTRQMKIVNLFRGPREYVPYSTRQKNSKNNGSKLALVMTDVHVRADVGLKGNTPRKSRFVFRVHCSVRGVAIGLAPVGLFFLFWLYKRPRDWRGEWRRTSVSIWATIEANLGLILALSIVFCQLGMMVIVLFIEPRYMTMVLPVLTAVASGMLAKPLGRYALPLLIAGLSLWSLVVLCKIPQWKYPIAVGKTMARLHKTGRQGTILSHSPIPAFYAGGKWCPIADAKGLRYKMSEEEIIEMCREAQVEFIVPCGSPYWRPYVWHKEFSPEFAEKWEAATLRFKWEEGETLIEIVDAEKLLKLTDPSGTSGDAVPIP